ncbi:MAG: GNAT family protein [archaeon]|jgi:ribosomal-protein-alanine N-acetyltransferase
MKIRIAEITDAKELFEIKIDKDFQKYFPTRIIANDLDTQIRELTQIEKDMEKGRGFTFIIEENDKTVGFVEAYKVNKTDKRCAIGFGIKKTEWKKGLATKAIKQTVEIIKKMGFHTIEATVFPGNIASEKVLDKNGFIKIGTMKDYYYANDKYIDRILYWKVFE